MLLLEDYNVRGVAQAYIAGLKVKSIIGPKLGNIRAAKLTTAQVKEYIRERRKKVGSGTVNRELGMLHRAFQLGYQQDPPLVARVPFFPKLPEAEPRKGFLKPELYKKLLLTLPASCIWMEGKRPNRKSEPVAVPIYGDMAKFLELQPLESEYLFARGSTPIRDFRRGGTRPVTKRACPVSCSTICDGPPSEIFVGRQSPSR